MALYWGWVVCASFLLLFTLSSGISFSFNEFMVPLSKDFQVSVGLLSMMGSLPVSLPLLAAPLATYFNYKIRTMTTVMIGVLVSTLTLAATPLIYSFPLLLIIYGVMTGMAIALIKNPPFFLLADYFPYQHPRHVLATSVIACAFPLGTLIFNPLTYALLASVGWRITYSVLAASMFVIGVGTTLTFRPRSEDEGDPSLVKSTSEGNEYEEIPLSNVSVATRTRLIFCAIWLLGSSAKGLGYYTPYLILVKQMTVVGIEQSHASNVMAVIGVCEFISRLVTSYIGDYFKGKILYLYVAFCLALCIPNGLEPLAATTTHFGIYGGALGLLGGPVIAALYSSSSEVLFGQDVHTIFSLSRVGLGIGSVIGPTLAGVVFDWTGSFHLMFYITSFTYFFAALMYALIIVLNKTRPCWVFPEEHVAPSKSHHDDISHKDIQYDFEELDAADKTNYDLDSIEPDSSFLQKFYQR